MTKHNALNPLSVKNNPAGKYCDGRGLWLIKSSNDRGNWILRYAIGGKRREMGLGSLVDVSLKEARKSAQSWRLVISAGEDPIRVRDQRVKEATRSRPSLRHVAEECFEARKAQLKGDGKAGRWFSPLELHVLPYIGSLDIEEVNQNDIKRALSKIWHSKAQTAKKAAGRLQIVMKHGAAMDLKVDMQAVDKAKALLGAQRHTVKSIPAMPWQEVPGFFLSCADQGLSARALQFLILTLARSSEIRFASWGEVNDGIWTIPSHKTKTGKEHRIPLSDPAINLLEDQKRFSSTTLIFPSLKNKPLSDMAMSSFMRRNGSDYRPHGFRSSFRDWVAETTNASREVAEACLAHSVGSKVELSYKRTDFLEKRRVLMERWADHVTGRPVDLVKLYA